MKRLNFLTNASLFAITAAHFVGYDPKLMSITPDDGTDLNQGGGGSEHDSGGGSSTTDPALHARGGDEHLKSDGKTGENEQMRADSDKDSKQLSDTDDEIDDPANDGDLTKDPGGDQEQIQA